MQLSKMNYEKLLAAAQHAKAETARADHAERGALEAQTASRINVARVNELAGLLRDRDHSIATRNETIVQLGNRLAAYGDPGTPMTIGATNAPSPFV